jgi:hypothetical protein
MAVAGIVVPGHPVAQSLPIYEPAHGEWTKERWQDILRGKLALAIFGVVEYDTGFPDVPGELGFAFEFEPGSNIGDYASRFEEANAPGYNYY